MDSPPSFPAPQSPAAPAAAAAAAAVEEGAGGTHATEATSSGASGNSSPLDVCRACCAKLTDPGSSRKRRITALAEVARLGEGLGARGVRALLLPPLPPSPADAGTVAGDEATAGAEEGLPPAPAAAAHPSSTPPALWRALLEHALHREKLVRVYAIRALRYLVADEELARCMFSEYNFLVPLMRAFDLDEISVTFDPRANAASVKQVAQTSEKLQALKLVRQLISVAPSAVPRGVCMVLMSVAEDTRGSDSTFKRACLESLRDLMLRNTQLVASCNGVQTLIKAMLASDSDSFAESVAYALLFVLNDPSTRCLLRPSLDIQMLFAPFTDSDVKIDAARRKRIEASGRVIVTMMRSWTGLFFLCSDEFGLRTLVRTLLLPNRTEIKQFIFKTIVDILRIAAPTISAQSVGLSGVAAAPPASHAMAAGGGCAPGESSPFGQPNRTRARAVSATGSGAGGSSLSGARSSEVFMRTELAPRPAPSNLLDNYAAVLVLALVHAGLLEALQRLGEGFDVEMAAQANKLMSDLMDLSNQLFPRDLCLALHRLPRLVSDACDFRPGADALARERACIVVTHLQKYGTSDEHGARSASASQLRWIREQVESRMSDEKWQGLLKESKVDLIKYTDCEQWNWEKISDIVNGPLRNPKRLHEVLSGMNFVKSVLNVVLPSKGRLEQMRRSPEALHYIDVVCELVLLLVASEEGRKHKKFVQLLREIKELLECERKGSGEYANVLSPSQFSSRMVREYFTILGAMSATATGALLLSDASASSSSTSTLKLLLHLCARSERLDITQTIVSSLHYDASRDSNTVLLLCLTEGHTNVRTCATQHLLHLCRASTVGFHEWGIDALLTQLNDKDDTVVRMALDILDEACDVPEYLDAAVLRNPMQQLSHLSKRDVTTDQQYSNDEVKRIAEVAHRILLRFAGHNTAVMFLQDLPRDSESGDRRGWLDAEIEEWDAHRNVRYVQDVEATLVKVLRNDSTASASSASGNTFGVALKQVALPPHLYGELGKTPNGCEVLRRKVHHIRRWVDMLSAGLLPGPGLQQPAVPATGSSRPEGPSAEEGAEAGPEAGAGAGANAGGSASVIAVVERSEQDRVDASGLELRAALWIIGHIGSAAQGWSLLQETVGDVLATVAQLATASPYLSLRGTCLYVVGMLSSTVESRHRLAQLNWARSEARSVAVPDIGSIHAAAAAGTSAAGGGGGLAQLFSVPALHYVGSWAEQSWKLRATTPAPADTGVLLEMVQRFAAVGALSEEEVPHVNDLLRHAADMQNTVMLQEAKAGLLKVKAEMPHIYAKPAALALLYRLMDGAPLALRVRKFLQRLFAQTRTDGADFHRWIHEGH